MEDFVLGEVGSDSGRKERKLEMLKLSERNEFEVKLNFSCFKIYLIVKS